jgi:hypothetical protein
VQPIIILDPVLVEEEAKAPPCPELEQFKNTQLVNTKDVPSEKTIAPPSQVPLIFVKLLFVSVRSPEESMK